MTIKTDLWRNIEIWEGEKNPILKYDKSDPVAYLDKAKACYPLSILKMGLMA